MRKTVINVENVSKKFKLFYDRPLTLKERMVKGGKGAYKDFYALRNVSFEVKQGSTVGLLGQNGCGKSTLLKMINRTMFPNSGRITIDGRVASLIELGAGFHPELSGRENVYNNATIFGFTKEEIDIRLPDIIAFSELEEFIDNPLRTYSSGMYARLAFSVAINVDADILLVDEILGVGDMNFQAKCANKIHQLKNSGVTILLVTHDMSTIDRLCDYAVWLNHGMKVAEGEPRHIETQYMKFMSEQQENKKITDIKLSSDSIEEEKSQIIREEKIVINSLGEHFGNGDVVFTNCKMLNEKGIDKRSFYTGESVTLQVEYICQISPEHMDVNIGFELSNTQGIYIYGTNTSRENIKKLRLNNQGMIEIKIKNLNLVNGEYNIGIAIANSEETISFDHYHSIAQFKMYSDIQDIGIVRLPHSFVIDGKEVSYREWEKCIRVQKKY